MQITMFTADCTGQAANCSYPNRSVVTTPVEMQKAVRFDHVCAEYKGNYRSIGNFTRSDVVVMDIDNDHTEEPAEWITPEKLDELLPDISYVIAFSRNHMKVKDGKAARPKFHVYFQITETTDSGWYAALKRGIKKRFDFFDGNALDAARFIFGADAGEVVWHEGWMTIDEEVEPDYEEPKNEDAGSCTGPILEGSRNNTMSRFAGRVLKKYGVTDRAREAFELHARRCDPPLPEDELNTIWNSAVKFYKNTVCTQPEYVEPDEYNAEFDSLKPEDFSDMGEAKALIKEYRDELLYTDATQFLSYDGMCWRENRQKAVGAVEEFLDMNYMAMAGWKTEDMLSGIEGVMNLAAASGEDLATTSDIVTDALTAFGLTAKDSGHFADILAAASSNANTNVSMMGETFKYCAPIAGALGFSAEVTAEAIGLMANAGIKGSQAGTSLRTIMNNLSGEVKICGSSIGEVTVATTNADGYTN